MKMAKKLLAVVLAGALALSVLAGCSSSSNKSLLDALNKAGNGVKFTLDKEASDKMTAANLEVLAKSVDEHAEKPSLKTLPRDEIVGWALGSIAAEEAKGASTLSDAEPATDKVEMTYAVVNNSLSAKKQAAEAISNAKKMTVTLEETEDGGMSYSCEFEKAALNSTNGYEVAYATVTTTKLGSFTLVVFDEAEPAQSGNN